MVQNLIYKHVYRSNKETVSPKTIYMWTLENFYQSFDNCGILSFTTATILKKWRSKSHMFTHNFLRVSQKSWQILRVYVVLGNSVSTLETLYFKVYNLISVHPKSMKLGQMTTLNAIFHLVSIFSFTLLARIETRPSSLPNFGMAFSRKMKTQICTVGDVGVHRPWISLISNPLGSSP